jgi:predicted ABC-type ATPase
VARVADRVRMGGHDVPEATIRRRYDAGLRNFFRLYMPLAAKWQMFDNSQRAEMRLIASGTAIESIDVVDASQWSQIKKDYGDDD